MKVNVLLTARDPATALSLIRVIPQLKKQHWLCLTIACQEPAASLFKQQGIEPDVICSNYQTAKSTIAALLADKVFDAVFTGISGPDKGIDELTLTEAANKSIKRYALQSMWGDFNKNIKIYPNTLFVLDHFASELNQQLHPDIINVEVGSIKHSHLDQEPIIDFRIAFREELQVVNDTKVLGFYGQPLAQIDGYKNTIKLLVNALQQWPKDFVLFYRPHPKEPQSLRSYTNKLFESLHCPYFIDNENNVFKSLAGADVVLSAFSTCAIDALYMNQELNQAINSSVYLWYDKELINWWQTYNPIDQLPLTSDPCLIYRVDNANAICHTIELAIKRKQQIKERAKDYLPNNHCAANIICQTLANDLILN